MEVHVKLSKPYTFKSSPLCCFLTSRPEDLAAVQAQFQSLFGNNPELVAKFGSPEGLWARLLAIRPSRCGNYIVGITDDSHLVLLDLKRSAAYTVQLSVIEGMLLCTVVATGSTVIIGGACQILIIHLPQGVITGVDFSSISSVKQVVCPLRAEKHKKFLAVWKNSGSKVARTDYSGDYHEVNTPRGIEVRGLVGILYTKEQYAALSKDMGEKEEEEKTSVENDAFRYTVVLTKVNYSDNESIVLSQKMLNVEYSTTISTQPTREACLIIRADSCCDMSLVALNSPHKYYCQLFLIPPSANSSMHLRPVNFISGNDILPTDRFGRTSLLISDIAWTPNDQLIVILFCSNYFCILSRLGQPLNILPFASPDHAVQHFCVISSEMGGEKVEDGMYPNLWLHEKGICMFGDAGSILLQYETPLKLTDLWQVEPGPGKVNKILRLLLSFPELGVQAPALECLERELDKEVVYFSPQKRASHESSKSVQPADSNSDIIQFKNPFPLEPTVEVAQIAAASLCLIEAARWTNSICNNLLELIQDELENASRLLYLKNEPMYFLHIMQMYKTFSHKQIVGSVDETTKFYGPESMAETVLSSNKTAFNFEKKKALLMFYCLIQFRNFKATSFNILYLVTAGLLRNKWGKRKVFSETINSVISTLKANLSSEKGKKQDFFETELKTTLTDKGPLYGGMQTLCETAFADPGTSQSPEDMAGGKEPSQIDPVSNDHAAESKKDESPDKQQTPLVSLADSLMSFYEPERLDSLYAAVGKIMRQQAGVDDAFRELRNAKENYISHIYNCVWHIKKGKIETALNLVKELLTSAIAPEALLKQDNKVERPLVLIIVSTCLLLISLALLSKGKRYTIDMCEVVNFLYKILSSESAQTSLDIVSKLRSPVEVSGNSNNRLSEIYSAVSILLQISAHQTAISILYNSNDTHSILLSLLILLNQLNLALSAGKDQQAKDYLSSLVKMVRGLSEAYPSHTVQHARDTSPQNVLSTCVGLSGKLVGLTILHVALPILSTQLRCLLYVSGLSPEQLVQGVPKPAAVSVQPCVFVAKLAKHFCGCSSEACQRVFGNYFVDSGRAAMFNSVMEEAVQILAGCTKAKLVELVPAGTAKGEVVGVSKIVPANIAEEIRINTHKLLRVVWELSLLMSIEGFRDKPELTSHDKTRLAGLLIRYSAMGESEQQELEYIQQGLLLLKSVNYADLRVSLQPDSELMMDLGNAFDIYTEKWEGIIKTDKATILSSIKSTNVLAYKVLSTYLARRKPSVRTHGAKGGPLDLDTVFWRMLVCVKQVLAWAGLHEGPLGQAVEQGETLRAGLRKTLEGADGVTGVPKTMALERENSKWVLKTGNPFAEANDLLADEAKYMGVVGEVLEAEGKRKDGLVIDDLDKFQCLIAGNALATWRCAGKGSGLEKLIRNIARGKTSTELLINEHRIKRRTPDECRVGKFVLENTLRNENAVNKLVSALQKVVSKTLRDVRKARMSLALKKNVRQLVPGRVRTHERKKSVSLVTQETEAVKPFALYSIKKDRIATSMANTMANNTPREQNVHTRIATEENKSHKFTESTRVESKPTHKRTASAQRPFSLIKVSSQTAAPATKEERTKKKKDLILGADIQIKIEKINKEYEKIKADSSKAKVHFLDRIKQQILASKKK